MLDSIIRLSQGRAKCELRTVVTAQDANDVVQLMQESLFEACCQEAGFSSTIDKIANGKKKSAAVVDENNISNLSIPK
jgi:DNA replicative helicase MCM subunit Mcm2 (Cdc46/Mcm family)